MKLRVALAVAAAVLALCGSALAHHGTNASYDMGTPVQITGKVTNWVWENPHARMFLDITGDDGKVVNFGVEMRNNPASLQRQGWTRRSVKVGDVVTMMVFKSKFGTPAGVGETNAFPVFINGEQLKGSGTGRGGRGGAAPPAPAP